MTIFCSRWLFLIAGFPLIILATIFLMVSFISKERTFHISAGETYIWSLSDSVLCGELSVTSSSKNVSLFYYAHEPLLKLSDYPVALTGRYWLNPTEHVMYSHYLEEGSIITLDFISIQGVNFFLFKGSVLYSQFETENQADYLQMKSSMNNIKEKLIVRINSADTYYMVFDNIYDDFYSHLDFKLSIQLMEYTNEDVNKDNKIDKNLYERLYPIECVKCLTQQNENNENNDMGVVFIIPQSFYSSGYLALTNTVEVDLYNITINKKNSHIWSPTVHSTSHQSMVVKMTVQGNPKYDMNLWGVIFIAFFCLYLLLLYFNSIHITNEINNNTNRDVSTILERTASDRAMDTCLEMTYLLDESAKKRVLRIKSEENVKKINMNKLNRISNENNKNNKNNKNKRNDNYDNYDTNNSNGNISNKSYHEIIKYMANMNKEILRTYGRISSDPVLTRNQYGSNDNANTNIDIDDHDHDNGSNNNNNNNIIPLYQEKSTIIIQNEPKKSTFSLLNFFLLNPTNNTVKNDIKDNQEKKEKKEKSNNSFYNYFSNKENITEESLVLTEIEENPFILEGNRHTEIDLNPLFSGRKRISGFKEDASRRGSIVLTRTHTRNNSNDEEDNYGGNNDGNYEENNDRNYDRDNGRINGRDYDRNYGNYGNYGHHGGYDRNIDHHNYDRNIDHYIYDRNHGGNNDNVGHSGAPTSRSTSANNNNNHDNNNIGKSFYDNGTVKNSENIQEKSEEKNNEKIVNKEIKNTENNENNENNENRRDTGDIGSDDYDKNALRSVTGNSGDSGNSGNSGNSGLSYADHESSHIDSCETKNEHINYINNDVKDSSNNHDNIGNNVSSDKTDMYNFHVEIV